MTEDNWVQKVNIKQWRKRSVYDSVEGGQLYMIETQILDDSIVVSLDQSQISLELYFKKRSGYREFATVSFSLSLDK